MGPTLVQRTEQTCSSPPSHLVGSLKLHVDGGWDGEGLQGSCSGVVGEASRCCVLAVFGCKPTVGCGLLQMTRWRPQMTKWGASPQMERTSRCATRCGLNKAACACCWAGSAAAVSGYGWVTVLPVASAYQHANALPIAAAAQVPSGAATALYMTRTDHCSLPCPCASM